MKESYSSRATFAVGSSSSSSCGAEDEGPAADGGVGSKGKYTGGGGGGGAGGGASKSGGYIGAKGMCGGCTGMTIGWSAGVLSGLCQQSIG